MNQSSDDILRDDIGGRRSGVEFPGESEGRVLVYTSPLLGITGVVMRAAVDLVSTTHGLQHSNILMITQISLSLSLTKLSNNKSTVLCICDETIYQEAVSLKLFGR